MQFSFVSRRAEEILGYPTEQWLQDPSFWLDHIHPEDRERVVAACRAATSSRKDQDFEYRMLAATGREVWLRNILYVHESGIGHDPVLRGIMLDTTNRKQTEAALQESNSRLQLLLEQMPAILWSTDTFLKITYSAGAGLSGLNLAPNQTVGMSLFEYFRTDDPEFPHIAQHRRALKGESLSYELAWMNRTFQAHLEPLRATDGSINGCLGVALDITERKRAEEKAQYLALTDPLTGLGNYRRLFEALYSELKRSKRAGRSFAVLLLDLDGLKRINDSHGHLTGSRALCRLAEILEAHCRAIDTAARYGGDEFALVLPETGAEEAEQVARRIAKRLSQDGEQPPLSVSIGVGVYPTNGNTLEKVLSAADRALYDLKAQGGWSRLVTQ